MTEELEIEAPRLRTFVALDRAPPRARVSNRIRARRLVADYWMLMLALGAIVALALSDFHAGTNAFWSQHQVVTSLVTGIALTIAVVFGIDRVLKERSRKRWEPIGMRIVEKLSSCIWTEELLYLVTLSHCQTEYGELSIPAGRRYSEVLLEALEDPRAWESAEAYGVPSLVDRVAEERVELEEAISIWAPVLIAEPDLAAVGACAEKLLEAVTQIKAALTYGEVTRAMEGGSSNPWEPGGRLATWLLRSLGSLAETSSEMDDLAAAYG